MMVNVFAPAKINLTLHVTGQRDDGYHIIDSLVAFASIGDSLDLTASETVSLSVEGREARGVPSDMRNLALKAVALSPGGRGAALRLIKRLPAASGIGGGSADAAAAFRAMLALSKEKKSSPDKLAAEPDTLLEAHLPTLLRLGADVPMCLLSRPLRVRGIGDILNTVDLPRIPAVLVNPRVAVSTPDVFRALSSKKNAGMPERLPDIHQTEELIAFLKTTRNDLEDPAVAIVPEIGVAKDRLMGAKGCRFARMSGSGATCFGLFSNDEQAREAARAIAADFPEWWIAACWLGNQNANIEPGTKAVRPEIT